MAVSFTGTSTGQRYEVGKTYSNGTGDYVARADGSFQKLGDRVAVTEGGKVIRENNGGHVFAGSSGNTSVSWYASGSDANAFAGGKGQALARVASRSTPSISGGDPNESARAATPVMSPRSVRVATSGNRGAALSEESRVSNPTLSQRTTRTGIRVAAAGQAVAPAWSTGRGMGWSGKDDPPQDVIFAGRHIKASPYFSNAELGEARWGDGEFLSPGWFHNWGVAIGDAAYNTGLAVNDIKKGDVKDFGDSVMEFGFGVRNNLKAETDRQTRVDAAAAKAGREALEAYDLKTALQFEEAQKQFERSGMPDSVKPWVLGTADQYPNADENAKRDALPRIGWGW